MNAFEQMKKVEAIEIKHKQILFDRELFSLSIMQKLDEIKDKEIFYKDSINAIMKLGSGMQLLNTNLYILALLVCNHNEEEAKLLAKSEKFREFVSFNDMYRVLIKAYN